MPDTPLSEKTGRAILSELQAIRRNQEARMSQGELMAAQNTRPSALPPEANNMPQPDPQSRVNDKLANLKTKG